jgi:hypothetical protein
MPSRLHAAKSPTVGDAAGDVTRRQNVDPVRATFLLLLEWWLSTSGAPPAPKGAGVLFQEGSENPSSAARTSPGSVSRL